ncbi:MAG TPA: adenylate/guanylate cyclase domain-containing protein, partial [Mycobacteriales bacterium]|nr:adenylate/guanylate cyclase domain-containing protein [Mycobacteriales bacterium]
MGCSACGAENRPGARFCNGCGAALAATCASCGQANPPGSRFCDGCGLPLTAPARPDTSTGVPPASPQSYTPRHLAEKILAGRDTLAGERKQVTVLFADIKGSTELIQDRDPEEAQQLLDGAVQVMMDAVHRYEGTVSRLMGDGLMAIFGAPVAHEDHAVRACYAALSLQDGMHRFEEQVRQTHGVGMEARIGLNSGEVVVRLVSDDLHMDYTAMGQTVHLASRLEQLAREGTALLSSATLALVEGYVQVLGLGPVPVKGLDGPIEVYRLLGAGQARTRLQAVAARGLTRFVGRQAELETLHAALAQARDGHGQVAALVGEPGVGKSRLVWELTHSHRTADWTVWEAGSVSYGKATSWLPAIDLLKSYCRIEGRDDVRVIREKVAGKVLMLDRALEPILAPLLALLDAERDPSASPDAPRHGAQGADDWTALEPDQRRRQTLDALKRLLLRESQVRPLLLVFEDLHWVDAETQALLDALVESLPAARLLLLVNYRPEYRHAWGGKTYYTQLRIDPLPAASVDELLDGLLGDDPSVSTVRRLLVERTQGNPFFLEESVRSLVEVGALRGERGEYRLAHQAPDLRVPATVQAVLSARIDRLSVEQKRLLQTASVLGKDVPYALLREVVRRDEPAGPAVLAGASASDAEASLQIGLAQLQAAEFLYEASLFPDLEYTFKHALTHEVAYGSLLGERRRALHRRVVAAVERLYSDRLTEHVERLADHAFRAEAWEQAAAYGRQAGAKAAGRAANREAVAAFERALAALSHLPETVETLQDGVDVRQALRGALHGLGEWSRQPELMDEAERLAVRLGDRRRLALVYQWQGFLLVGQGQLDQAVELTGRAVAMAEELGDERLLVTAPTYLGFALLYRADYHQAVRVFRQNLVTIERVGGFGRLGMSAWASVLTLVRLSRCLAELGKLDEAVALADEAYEVAQQDGRPYTLCLVLLAMANVAMIRGDLSAAISSNERAIEIAQTHDLQGSLNRATGGLGLALTASN